MLDAETKRRIDTARNALVGKVPDPTSQVEQITIALTYKFMDDIDAESEAFGGARTFFAGEFARYAWPKLMHPGLGGHEMLLLYAEAIERMNENPDIPQLFRDIFRNAFLPYRDPETLRGFLKVIDGFTYDHSERLGDAYEYLLSIMDSQGDAGQFRTPRHIIDFIVSIVDPKKDEVVIDPACGTAGFLISSYKHIIAANTDLDGNNTLTPDERILLAGNFKGYDISPDFVRLSLVNMYLHGFVEPHIFEYDTLSSEERWNEFADVILANPPFMTPKGGIRPHNRFSIKASRSEVLFVDYIAEHLNAGGRAGIVVPEGITFRIENAYKQLRRKLVEESLVAAVSLPAGVFNPYSPVKTSILLLDKVLARKTDRVAFFKVENDGYDLGAQRRPIEQNDLPQVLAQVTAYLQLLRTGVPKEEGQSSMTAMVTDYIEDNCDTDSSVGSRLVIERDRIAADGEYNLSAQRYRKKGSLSTAFPTVSIGSYVETITPPAKLKRTEFLNAGRFQIIDQSQEPIAGWTNDPESVIWPEQPLVIFGDHTCSVKLVDLPFAQGADGIKILRTASELDPAFLYRVLQVRPLPSTGYRRHFSLLKRLQIPLPPMEVQRKVIKEIEGYEQVIEGARAVVENYRPHIHIDPDWPMVTIEDISSVESGFRFPTDFQGDTDQEIPFLKVSDMNLPGNEDRIVFWNNSVSLQVLKSLNAKSFPEGTVIFPKIGAAIATNKKRILNCRATFDNNVMGIVPNEQLLLPGFLHALLLDFDISNWASDAQPPSMRKSVVQKQMIPLPPLEIQEALVREIESEQTLVDANHELIKRFGKKVQESIEWVYEGQS